MATCPLRTSKSTTTMDLWYALGRIIFHSLVRRLWRKSTQSVPHFQRCILSWYEMLLSLQEAQSKKRVFSIRSIQMAKIIVASSWLNHPDANELILTSICLAVQLSQTHGLSLPRRTPSKSLLSARRRWPRPLEKNTSKSVYEDCRARSRASHRWYCSSTSQQVIRIDNGERRKDNNWYVFMAALLLLIPLGISSCRVGLDFWIQARMCGVFWRRPIGYYTWQDW